MKISSFEASLIRNIKFSMVIFSSIVCLNGHKSGDCNTNVGQISRKRKNNYRQLFSSPKHCNEHKKTGVIPCFTIYALS